MNIERLRKIIAYSDKNHDEIYSMIKRFCSFAGIEYDSDLLNVLQIVRSSFQKKGFLVLEIPFADDEIGALCYKGDGLGYVVINTSLPKVNTNFAISHEIYHVFWGENEFVSKVEFSDDHYYEHEEKLADLWLDEAIMKPSKKDDYLHVEAIVKKFGKKYVEDGYINERTLDKVLHNMRELYQKIRRE